MSDASAAARGSRIPVLIAIVVVGIASGYWYFTRPIPFDSGAWKLRTATRQRMVNDLLSRQFLKGMTRAEVDALLGRPNPPDSIHEGAYAYWAGTDGVIDDMWLEIEFKNDLVSRISYRPD